MSRDKTTNSYDDIINLPHHVSASRPQMPLRDRAAQFAPFSALSGFGAAIAETGRLTDKRIELDEYEKAVVNDQLNVILERIKDRPVVTLTFFRPDEKKAGGAYVTVTEAVKKIDEYERLVVMADGRKIPIDDIVEIDIEDPRSL